MAVAVAKERSTAAQLTAQQLIGDQQELADRKAEDLRFKLAHATPVTRTWYQWLELDQPGQKPDVIMCLIGCAVYFLAVMIKPLEAIVMMIFQPTKALSFSCLVGEIVAVGLHSFVLAMWFSLAFGYAMTPKVLFNERANKVPKSFFHNLMSKGFMPGGFSPRWFAASLGILLFVNQNLLATVNIPGAIFNSPGPGAPAAIAKWPADIGCKANSRMPATAGSMWLSRFWIQDPNGCYEVKDGALGFGKLKMGERYGVLRGHFYVRPNATLNANIVNPFVEGSTTEVDKTKMCMYTCVMWKSTSMQNTMLKSGIIIAGGVLIEKVTNWVTTHWGYAFCTHETSPAHMAKVLDILLAEPTNFLANFRRLVFLIAMVGIEALVYFIAPMVSQDGYFTTDYYVSAAIFLSILLASLLRNFDILEGRRAVYTQKLWAQGSIAFHCRSVHKMMVLDLYEWSHVPPVIKAQLLMDYARRVDALKTPPFDLEKFFMERGKKEECGIIKYSYAVSRKAGQSGAVPAASGAGNDVNQSLLDIDKRIASLEGGLPKQAPASMAHGGVEARGRKVTVREETVRCVKEYESFADIIMQDDDGDWVPCKVMLRIKENAIGTLKGSTPCGTLLRVEWNKTGDNIEWPHDQLNPRNEATLMAAATFLSDIKDDFVLEINDEWHTLQIRCEKAYKAAGLSIYGECLVE